MIKKLFLNLGSSFQEITKVYDVNSSCKRVKNGFVVTTNNTIEFTKIDQELGKRRFSDKTEPLEDEEINVPQELLKGFRPNILIHLGLKEDVFDLPMCQKETAQIIENLATKNSSDFNFSKDQRHIIRGILKTVVLPDGVRRKVWRSRIGNRLNITESHYTILKKTYQAKGIPKKIEKVILGDLNRTFPDCKTFNEGEKMYSTMRTMLSVFHIYRPDISYVQGMTCLLGLLYYMYSEFEAFMMLANLLICNPLVHSFYTFERGKVNFLLFLT